MTDLHEFLRARYTEARTREENMRRVIPSAFDGHEVEMRGEDGVTTLLVDGHPYPIETYHEIATEPAPDLAVLADLNAKLSIVARHERCGSMVGYCDDGGHGWDEVEGGGCADLGDLALAFAAHPDYDERWRP